MIITFCAKKDARLSFWINKIACLVASKNRLPNIMPYLSGQITRDQYLSRIIPGYQAFTYANKHLPKDAYVWMTIWEARGYFLDRRYMWANLISQRDFVWEHIDDPHRLADELRSRGFTHILFQTTDTYQYVYNDYPHNQKIANLVLGMLKSNASLIYRAEPIELYRLKP